MGKISIRIFLLLSLYTLACSVAAVTFPDQPPDTDYFVKKVGYEGSELSNGFTLMFGGEGSETAKKIIQADDNGYVFIGTLENTNDVDFIVLVKITKDGQLIN